MNPDSEPVKNCSSNKGVDPLGSGLLGLLQACLIRNPTQFGLSGRNPKHLISVEILAMSVPCNSTAADQTFDQLEQCNILKCLWNADNRENLISGGFDFFDAFCWFCVGPVYGVQLHDDIDSVFNDYRDNNDFEDEHG